MSGKPNWWRVWLDGQAVTEPVLLADSTDRWRPIATAESWNGGRAVCNSFAYRFDGVAVASAKGGSWRPFTPGFTFQDRGFAVRAAERGTRRAADTRGVRPAAVLVRSLEPGGVARHGRKRRRGLAAPSPVGRASPAPHPANT